MSNELETLNRVVSEMPPDAARQVLDFALFLRTRGGRPVEFSEEWTREDELDFSRASMRYYDSQNSEDEGYDDVPTR